MRRELALKKLTIAVLVVVCLALAAISCGPTAPPGVIKARYSGWSPPPSIVGKVEVYFFDKLKEKVGDRLDVEVFQGNTLYNYQEVQLPLKTGAVEMAAYGTIELYEWATPFKVTTLTGAWTTDELLAYMNSSDFKSVWKDILDVSNSIPFCMYPAGTFYLWSTKPLTSTADFAGFRVECGNFEPVEIIKDLGGSGGALMVTDIYTALQQGMYDAAIGTPSIALGFGWPEFVKYVSKQAWFSNINVMLINKDFWDSLPNDIKDAFEETAKETTEYSLSYIPQGEEGQLKAIEDKWGVTYFTISDWDKIIDTAQTKVWPDIRDDVGTKFFDKALEYTSVGK
jgi:TRAP-type C4-dicarboxylate transport system substrate-binding protein